MEYLIILLLFLASAVFIRWRYPVRLFHSRKEMLIFFAVIFVIGVIWDSFAIFRGHWAFPGTGLIGIEIGLMPLEEFLFVIIMPFWVLTVYKIIEKKIK